MIEHYFVESILLTENRLIARRVLQSMNPLSKHSIPSPEAHSFSGPLLFGKEITRSYLFSKRVASKILVWPYY